MGKEEIVSSAFLILMFPRTEEFLIEDGKGLVWTKNEYKTNIKTIELVSLRKMGVFKKSGRFFLFFYRTGN